MELKALIQKRCLFGNSPHNWGDIRILSTANSCSPFTPSNMIYIKNNTVWKKSYTLTNKSTDITYSNEYQILIFLVFWGEVGLRDIKLPSYFPLKASLSWPVPKNSPYLYRTRKLVLYFQSLPRHRHSDLWLQSFQHFDPIWRN